MAVPFAQTTRSLKADRGIARLVVLGLLSLLLAGWLIWAFTAQFFVYTSSESMSILLENSFSAIFVGEMGEELQNGQQALIYLDAPPLSEPVVLPAQIFGVERVAGGVEAQVAPDFRQIEQGPVSDEIMSVFSTPVSGHVAVAVEKLSPATLILRSIGINADTASLISTP